MLIGHDAVETYLVGQGILFMVLVVEHMGLFRVEVSVGRGQTSRLEFFQLTVGYISLSLLQKPVNIHLVLWPGQSVNRRRLRKSIWDTKTHW